MKVNNVWISEQVTARLNRGRFKRWGGTGCEACSDSAPTLLRSTRKQKASSCPMCADISVRQMLSRRIALSSDDLYFLKLKVWNLLLWFQLLLCKCVGFFFSLSLCTSVTKPPSDPSGWARLHGLWMLLSTLSFVLCFTLGFWRERVKSWHSVHCAKNQDFGIFHGQLQS